MMSELQKEGRMPELPPRMATHELQKRGTKLRSGCADREPHNPLSEGPLSRIRELCLF